ILLNTIPLALFWYFFRNYKDNVEKKVIMWTYGLPIVFVSACFVYVWPILYSGESDIIMYVHSANVFIITMTYITVSPPPKYLYIQSAMLITFFVGPLAWLLHRNGNHILLSAILNDLAIAFIASTFIANQIYKLRLK